MYEQHFGLKKRPFRANPTGTDVFVGPQIVATMAGIKLALASNDAIVTVAGPVGSGKTTLITRTLETISNNRSIIQIGRMRLDSSDVLELLLDELGVQEKPAGTIQKFGFFRRRLKALEDQGTRVFIAVEDASRLGVDTLAELEALTAADAGDSEGASVVLMGDENLDAVIDDPQLVRLQQRTRQRYTTTPLCTAELRGYLRHCFRLAGGNFEQIFEANAADLLHHLSKGIPRISNNLVESAMTAAADQDLQQVSTALLARVAENEYGLSAADFDLTPPAASEPEVAPAPEPAPLAEPEPVQGAAEAVIVPELPVPDPVIVFAESPLEGVEDDQVQPEIPQLVQDTLPDLEILAPELAAASKPDPEPAVEPVVEPELPAAAESSGDDVPAWDRDPTVAELKPDLAALEKAMAFAQSESPEPPVDDSAPVLAPKPAEPEVVPEITLDHAISQRIENNLIDEPGEVSRPAVENKTAESKDANMPAVSLPPKQNKKADAELEKIAAELAKAKSIEDVDDKLAETLFGDELSLAAAQFLVNKPQTESANEDIDVAAPAAPTADGSEVPDVEVTLQAPKKLDDGATDLSASQRLKTVRALNADLHPSIRETEAVAPDQQPPPPPASTPDSIEDQITSMTQTLKALNVRPPLNDDDMDDENTKSGFFSRFKR